MIEFSKIIRDYPKKPVFDGPDVQFFKLNDFLTLSKLNESEPLPLKIAFNCIKFSLIAVKISVVSPPLQLPPFGVFPELTISIIVRLDSVSLTNT